MYAKSKRNHKEDTHSEPSLLQYHQFVQNFYIVLSDLVHGE